MSDETKTTVADRLAQLVPDVPWTQALIDGCIALARGDRETEGAIAAREFVASEGVETVVVGTWNRVTITATGRVIVNVQSGDRHQGVHRSVADLLRLAADLDIEAR